MNVTRESIELDIEESNSLVFKVNVEGSASDSPARVRLVCEDDGVSYMFNGHPQQEPGTVEFVIPNMSNRLREGSYPSRVEVLIENRYFAPVEFDIDFKKAVKVVAEHVSVPQRARPDLSVTAVPVIVQKRQVGEPHPLVVEPTRDTQNVPRRTGEVTTVTKQKTLRERYGEREIKGGDNNSISEAELRSVIRKLISKEPKKKQS